MSPRPARRRDDLVVVLGDYNGTVRVGTSDLVCVKVMSGTTPIGFTLALLPRRNTSTNADTAATAADLDDLLLPAAGQRLIAEHMTDPSGLAQLRIDISSLPASV